MKIFKTFINKITLESYFRKNLSTTMTEKVSEYNLNYSKYLITLSTSSIALTFAILQLLYKGVVINYLNLIRISWYLFTATILLGLIFNLLDILKTFFNSNAERLAGNEETIKKENLSEVIKNSKISHKIARYSYLVLIIQTITFFFSIISLVVFLSLNF